MSKNKKAVTLAPKRRYRKYTDSEIAEALLILFQSGGNHIVAEQKVRELYQARQESLGIKPEDREKGPGHTQIRNWYHNRTDLYPDMLPQLNFATFNILQRLQEEKNAAAVKHLAVAAGILLDKVIVTTHINRQTEKEPTIPVFATQINNYNQAAEPISPTALVHELAATLKSSALALVSPSQESVEGEIVNDE